jgi:hypothetical protein
VADVEEQGEAAFLAGIADQRALGREVARLSGGDHEPVARILSNPTNDQRAACRLGCRHREAKRARERVLALANRGFEILDPEEGPGKALVNPKPDQEQSQNDEVGPAKHERCSSKPSELESKNPPTMNKTIRTVAVSAVSRQLQRPRPTAAAG